ncbi:MAG TPA: DMT family transporter [Burkholderiales bacterium]|nr:DMT family transporter [Burkholderiales bacterium]
MPGRALGFAVLAAGVAVVSFASILVRLAHAEGAPSLAIAAVRLGVAALALAPFAWTRAGRELAALRGRNLVLCLASGLLLAAHFWAWITSLEYTSVASSTALVTTNPLWVALASALLLRERPAPGTVAGLALTAAGSVLVFAADAGGDAPSRDSHALGNALAVLGAVTASGYLLAGRALRARISLVAYVWAAYATAAVVLLLVAGAGGVPFASLPASAWLLMAALGLGPQLVGHTALNWALRRLSASFVAVAILGEPVGAALLAWICFGEGFGALQFCGFVLLLAGIFMAARAERGQAA